MEARRYPATTPVSFALVVPLFDEKERVAEGLGPEVLALRRRDRGAEGRRLTLPQGGPLPGGYGQSTASAMSVVRAWSSRLTGASR